MAIERRVLNNDYGIADIQENLLKALDILDSLCRKYKISYTLHGGTLLGAERDHHMIPWDDDIDISMRRKDFEKLKRLLKSGKAPDSVYIDEGTLWIPRFILKSEGTPIIIDILIWDYITDNKIGQKIKINLLRACQGMMKQHIDYSSYSAGGKALIFATHLMGKPFKQEDKAKLYRFIETKVLPGKKKCIHRSNDSFKGIAQIHDTAFMDNYSELELEGKPYMVNEDYRKFLVIAYGEDYMTPPPMKDRHPDQEHEFLKQTVINNRAEQNGE